MHTMHILKILIKCKVNEAKGKIIHKLGGYTATDMNIKLNQGIQSHITQHHLQDLHAYFCVPRDKVKALGPADIDDIKRKIFRSLSEHLEPFVEFTVLDCLDDPESGIVTIMGGMRLLVPEHGGEFDLDYFDRHAVWQEHFTAKVDRGGDGK